MTGWISLLYDNMDGIEFVRRNFNISSTVVSLVNWKLFALLYGSLHTTYGCISEGTYAYLGFGSIPLVVFLSTAPWSQPGLKMRLIPE